MRAIQIYGHGDTSSETGFPRPSNFISYITHGIFETYKRRHVFNKDAAIDVMVLTRKGEAYGYFEIESSEFPTPAEKAANKNPRRVYIVKKSALFRKRFHPSEHGYDVAQEGLAISEDDLTRLIELGEGIDEYPQPPYIDPRYARICFNSNGWRRPTGTADETISYYAKHGFGHEEWLFNYEWCIDGFKYGFLQPFNNVLSHRGKWFSLKLFTTIAGRSYLAATISKVYVPQMEELQVVYERMEANGWVAQMRQDLRNLKWADVDALDTTEPQLFNNVRFKQEDVTLYDPMPEFDSESKPRTGDRYKLLEDDGKPLPTLGETDTPSDEDDYQTMRAAQQGVLVDLAHRRLQDEMLKWLRSKYGHDAVKKEVDCVDVRVKLGDDATFYEIKMDTSAKRCIRSALGQLFEYSSYATESKAKTWIVVGDPIMTDDDRAYLGHLRKKFDLPIYYARWDWQMVELRYECPEAIPGSA